MNNLKKEEESTMPKNDKLNNSETEYFKSSNEIKVLDIISKVKAEKAENSERTSKISKRTISEFKEKSEINQNEEEDDILDDSDDNIKIEKKTIEVEKTTAAEVLKESKLDPKENIDL